MYGLFRVSCDYYRWNDLEVVSKDIDKLKQYYYNNVNQNEYKYPLIVGDDAECIYEVYYWITPIVEV